MCVACRANWLFIKHTHTHTHVRPQVALSRDFGFLMGDQPPELYPLFMALLDQTASYMRAPHLFWCVQVCRCVALGAGVVLVFMCASTLGVLDAAVSHWVLVLCWWSCERFS